jgi:hypothetical protein
MEHKTVLTEAARVLGERGKEYGSPEACFTRIATVATNMLGRPVSRYEVAAILAATKMGRMMESPMKADTYIDLANYTAFMAQFANDADAGHVSQQSHQISFELPTSVRAHAESAISDALATAPAEITRPAPPKPGKPN